MTRTAGALVFSAVLSAAAWAQQDNCHLHAPGDHPSFSRQPLVIPAVGDAAACAQVNRARFGGRGRCHCNPDGPGGERRPPEPFAPAPDAVERLP